MLNPRIPTVSDINNALKDVNKVVIVMSGKGGVGKTLISCSLAIGLNMKGRSVAILDADIHGPSVPWLLGIANESLRAFEEDKILPVEVNGIDVVSFDLLLDVKEMPIIWRGPLKTRALLEIISKTLWNKKDYLIIDMPPGTGDEPLTIIQWLRDKISGALLVITPGMLVKHVVSKAKTFLHNTNVKYLGTVVNMAYFKCPVCGSIHRVLGTVDIDSKEIIAEIPIDPELAKYAEKGMIIEYLKQEDETAKRLLMIATYIESVLSQTLNIH